MTAKIRGQELGVVRVADLLSAIFDLADAGSGITSAQRAAGAMPMLNETKDALQWSAIGVALVGSSVVGSAYVS
jgi:hypothetical protein